MNISDLQFIFSGGAANVTPANSIGGAISTAAGKRIDSQTATAPVNITGVALTDAYGNSPGVGTLAYVNATKTLRWKPYGVGVFADKAIPSSGVYPVGSSNGYVVANVTYGSLPTGDRTDSITVANNLQNLFDNIAAGVALVGKTSYRCFYVLNTHPTDTALACRIWVKQQPQAGDLHGIGLHPGGKNTTAELLANELAVPASVSFSAPVDYSNGLLLGDLAPGEYYAVWQRRVIPPETRGVYANNTAIIALSATV